MFGPLLGLAGSVISGIMGNRQAERQMDAQKEFAQEGIRWKVADAKAAGIHPLAGLGTPPFNFSPIPVGTPDFGASLSEMGANIDRSVMAQKTAPQRASIASQALGLERGKLENDLLKVQLVKATRELPPPMQSPNGVAGGKTNLLSPVSNMEVQRTSPPLLVPIKDAAGVSYLTVQNPGLGSTMEQHYSDVGGNVIGAPALASDLSKMGYSGLLQALPSTYIGPRRYYKDRRGRYGYGERR